MSFLGHLWMTAFLTLQLGWLAVMLGVVALAATYVAAEPETRSRRVGMQAAAFVGPATIVLWSATAFGTRGIVGAQDGPVWQDTVHSSLAAASVALVGSIGWTIRRTRHAWLYVPVALAAVALTAAAYFVGFMALADDWL